MRRELFVLLKNVAKLSLEEAVNFVGGLLQAVAARSSGARLVGEGERRMR